MYPGDTHVPRITGICVCVHKGCCHACAQGTRTQGPALWVPAPVGAGVRAGHTGCQGPWVPGTVGARGHGCQGLWVPGTQGAAGPLGDTVPQWCRWCGWTRAALRAPGCHATRRCGGRSPPTWRPPSSCPTASSGPPRAGVSPGAGGNEGTGGSGTGWGGGGDPSTTTGWQGRGPQRGAGGVGDPVASMGLAGLGGHPFGHGAGMTGDPGTGLGGLGTPVWQWAWQGRGDPGMGLRGLGILAWTWGWQVWGWESWYGCGTGTAGEPGMGLARMRGPQRGHGAGRTGDPGVTMGLAEHHPNPLPVHSRRLHWARSATTGHGWAGGGGRGG